MDFQHILEDIYIKLNQYRLYPRQSVNKLSQLKSQFKQRIFRNKYNTRQGVTALHNLIQDLSVRQPSKNKLKWSFALHMVADQQAALLGQNGVFTTEGTQYHKKLPQRVRISEVYQFGGKTSEQILQQLLIDDGLTSRKRRNTLLDPIFQYIGVGCSFHEKNQTCTVIILAQDIISLVCAEKNGQYRKRNGIETGQQNIVKISQQKIIDNIYGKQITPKLMQNQIKAHNYKINYQKKNISLVNQNQIKFNKSLNSETQQKLKLYSNQIYQNKNYEAVQRKPTEQQKNLQANQNKAIQKSQIVRVTQIVDNKKINQNIQEQPRQSLNQPSKQFIHLPLVQKRKGSLVIYQPNNSFYHPSLIKSQIPSDFSQSYKYYDSYQLSASYQPQNSSQTIQNNQTSSSKNKQSLKPSQTKISQQNTNENQKQSKCNLM